MGKRRDILIKIKDILHGVTLENSVVLKATNSSFDPLRPASDLPKVAVLAEPEVVTVGLYGETKDTAQFRAALIGYTFKQVDESLFDAIEYLIEAIKKNLTSHTNAQSIISLGFAITQLGPITPEQFDDAGFIGLIYCPINMIYLE